MDVQGIHGFPLSFIQILLYLTDDDDDDDEEDEDEDEDEGKSTSTLKVILPLSTAVWSVHGQRQGICPRNHYANVVITGSWQQSSELRVLYCASLGSGDFGNW